MDAYLRDESSEQLYTVIMDPYLPDESIKQ